VKKGHKYLDRPKKWADSDNRLIPFALWILSRLPPLLGALAFLAPATSLRHNKAELFSQPDLVVLSPATGLWPPHLTSALLPRLRRF
jgi:hypothetical protein